MDFVSNEGDRFSIVKPQPACPCDGADVWPGAQNVQDAMQWLAESCGKSASRPESGLRS